MFPTCILQYIVALGQAVSLELFASRAYVASYHTSYSSSSAASEMR